MNFQNLQINTPDLPSVSEITFQKLSINYKNVEYISTLIFYGVLLIAWILIYFINPFKMPWLSWVLLGLWAGMFLYSFYLVGRRYESAGYALRQHDITYKSGVLFHSMTSLPFTRIQHSEISQGPLESMFGLATLRIFTAGGSGSDLSIEGLSHEDALKIKDFITEKTGKVSEEINGQ